MSRDTRLESYETPTAALCSLNRGRVTLRLSQASVPLSLLFAVLAAGAAAHAAPPGSTCPSGAVDLVHQGSASASPSKGLSLAARIAAMPKNLPRAKGPPLQDAIEAARAAQQACGEKAAKVSVLVADSAGEPVVLLSGDGAGVRSQLIASTKVAIVVRYGAPSGEVAARAKSEPKLTAEAAADPKIGVLRGGGFPVRVAGQVVAIVAVSGGSLGGVMGLDEECAQVAVKRLQQAHLQR